MSNIAAAWVNIAGNATLTASSEAAGMPVSLLQQEDVQRVFRTGAATTVSILATYAANQSADAFWLLWTNLTAAGKARLRLSSVDATGAAGDIWDTDPTGLVAGQVDPNYKTAPFLSATVRSGWKYLRFDLTDTSLSFHEAGFLFVGTRVQFTYNYAFGAQDSWVDPSIKKKTAGMQTKVQPRPRYRVWDIPVANLTETQRWDVVEAIDRDLGASAPFLLIKDPASLNLGRDSLYGFQSELSPVPVIQGFGPDGGLMYSKTYKHEQRC